MNTDTVNCGFVDRVALDVGLMTALNDVRFVQSVIRVA
jgi:hypothetical protein